MNQYRALIAREENGRMVVCRRFNLRANTIDAAAEIVQENIDSSTEVLVHIKLKDDGKERH